MGDSGISFHDVVMVVSPAEEVMVPDQDVRDEPFGQRIFVACSFAGYKVVCVARIPCQQLGALQKRAFAVCAGKVEPVLRMSRMVFSGLGGEATLAAHSRSRIIPRSG